MLIRVLTLRYDPVLDAFDEQALRELQRSHRVTGVRDHFFERDGEPLLTLVLRCEMPAEPGIPVSKPADARGGERWRELLRPDDLPLFNALRGWRSARARRDGVPPYVVCTNKQLALLVRAQPRSAAKIGEVEGFGRAKVDKYAAEILGIMGAPSAQPDAPAGGEPKPAGHDDENGDG